MPRYPTLTYLTESAAQLFEQTKVPDLLYHEKEDGEVQDWQDDFESDRSEETSAERKLYTEFGGLNVSKRRYGSPIRDQLCGVVR